MTTTRGQLWRTARDRFEDLGFSTAALDARVLLEHCLGIDTTRLILTEGEPVSAAETEAYLALVARRLTHEPVARIVGHKAFYGLEFAVNGATLIPRPETEMLVDFGLQRLKGHSGKTILDLGTGSGCIVLSLLANLPAAQGVGVDLAPQAVLQALENAQSLGVADRFTGLAGDWFGPVAGQGFDLIVSNPPYIASSVLAGLDREVREFDPVLALDGGPDGLAPYEVIVSGAVGHLVPGGALALEIGFDQGVAVRMLLENAGFADVVLARDMAGHPRMVTGVWPGQPG